MRNAFTKNKTVEPVANNMNLFFHVPGYETMNPENIPNSWSPLHPLFISTARDPMQPIIRPFDSIANPIKDKIFEAIVTPDKLKNSSSLPFGKRYKSYSSCQPTKINRAVSANLATGEIELISFSAFYRPMHHPRLPTSLDHLLGPEMVHLEGLSPGPLLWS